MTARIAALVAAYREGADPRMRALPIYNPALEIEAVGFQPWPGGSIGIMITPWFMNTVLLPRGGADRHPGEGSTHRVILPSGSYEFVAAWIEGVGMIRNCSLFSPMTDFVDQRAARLTAEAALTALLTAEGNAVPTQAAPPRETPAAISRRQLLRGANGSF
ncbi:MAG: [NiFe]-hydrogenase assembly chaperone HybE [Azospirillaceae bacterium]|nr:[NiFe]-hydrogenase assembly chaperone HybE [Azospirillaceae bacterium]